jgi:hypothetical protein
MLEKKQKVYLELERPEVLKNLWIILYVICGLTLVPEFFISRHPHFGFDGFFGFYALLGFVSCAILILLAKLGGLFLKKKEHYYHEEQESL